MIFEGKFGSEKGDLPVRELLEKGMLVVEREELPAEPDPTLIHRLLPVDRGPDFYRERTDRNLGWVTAEEQLLLSKATVAVAGCGGMGGVGAELLLRAGIGQIRLADPELFDPSNIHRQVAAGVATVGTPKAFATTRRLREISDDTTLVVYPQGVTPENCAHFVSGANLVLDEVEAFAVAARIGLHQEARRQGVHVLNGNSIGAGTRLFLFTPKSDTMEQCLGMTYDEALRFHERFRQGVASREEKQRVALAVINGLLPEIPEYSPDDPVESTRRNLYRRLVDEGKAMILASNPYGAASFLVTHAIFYLLRDFNVKRSILRPIPMPGYIYRDDLLGQAGVREGKWY